MISDFIKEHSVFLLFLLLVLILAYVVNYVNIKYCNEKKKLFIEYLNLNGYDILRENASSVFIEKISLNPLLCFKKTILGYPFTVAEFDNNFIVNQIFFITNTIKYQITLTGYNINYCEITKLSSRKKDFLKETGFYYSDLKMGYFLKTDNYKVFENVNKNPLFFRELAKVFCFKIIRNNLILDRKGYISLSMLEHDSEIIENLIRSIK